MIFFLILSCLGGWLWPSGVMASGSGLSVSPPFLEITLENSEVKETIELSYKNETSAEIMVKLSAVDFGSLDESGGVAFLNTNREVGERKYALASWLSLEKDWLTLGPNETEKVKITILNRDSLINGGHYGAVLATLKNDFEKKEIVGVSQSVGSLFYVLKKGGENKILTFNKIDFDNNLFELPKVIKLRFRNQGNVHLIPRGKIEIYDYFGRKISKGIINESSSIIIPESFRIWDIKMQKPNFWLWPGKYTIEVDYRYDDQPNFERVSQTIWYFGWETVVMLLLMLFISLILVRNRL